MSHGLGDYNLLPAATVKKIYSHATYGSSIMSSTVTSIKDYLLLVIEIMDILYQTDCPMLQVNAHSGSINCLAVHDGGGYVCLGKDDGTVALMELSEGFVTSPNMKVKLLKIMS